MNNTIKILFASFFSLATMCGYAEMPTIKATIDSTTMVMGNQTHIRVVVVKDKSVNGHLCIPTDTLMAKVEIVGEVKIETAEVSVQKEQISYTIPIQIFDPGTYSIPGLKYAATNDTIAGNSVSIKVSDVDVSELEKNGLYDYKKVAEPDKKFWDFLPDWQDIKDKYQWVLWLLGALILLGLIILGVVLYQRWKAGKPIIPFLPHTKPLLPPYEEAIESLMEIKRQKLAMGDKKVYYSRLVDVARRYLWRQYSIPAMEMTSPQILSAIRSADELQMVDKLQFVLETSDFVKFAKMEPTTEENEISFNSVEEFIESNKPQIEESADDKNIKSDK